MALRQVYEESGALKSRDVAGSGSANADSTNYDNTLTGLPTNVQEAIDKTTGNISGLDTVELTVTAAHTHAVGSTFLFIGQLVETTAAIAVGDTIAIGTNVKATSILNLIDQVNSDLSDLNSNLTAQTATLVGADNTYLNYPLQLYYVGNIVVVTVNNFKDTFPVGESIALGSFARNPVGRFIMTTGSPGYTPNFRLTTGMNGVLYGYRYSSDTIGNVSDNFVIVLSN